MLSMKHLRNKKNKRKGVRLLFFGALLGLVIVLITGKRFFFKRTDSLGDSQNSVSFKTNLESFEMALKNLGIPISSKTFEKDYLTATLSSGTTLYLPVKDDYSSELASLQIIFKNIRIEGKWPEKIDLRFSRPVLSY